MRANKEIQRFGFRGIAERAGNQCWKAFLRPENGTVFGTYRSRGRAIGALIAHFQRQYDRKNPTGRVSAGPNLANIQHGGETLREVLNVIRTRK